MMRRIIKIIQNRIIKWILVIGCMLSIFAMSHLDSVKSWYMTGKVLTTIEQTTDETSDLDYSEEIQYYSAQESAMLILRKSAHVIEYFVLFLLLFNALYKPSSLRNNMVIASVIAVVYAVLDEIHQLFVPGRSGTVLDVLTDSLGVFMGCLAILVVVKLNSKKKEKTQVT